MFFSFYLWNHRLLQQSFHAQECYLGFVASFGLSALFEICCISCVRCSFFWTIPTFIFICWYESPSIVSMMMIILSYSGLAGQYKKVGPYCNTAARPISSYLKIFTQDNKKVNYIGWPCYCQDTFTHKHINTHTWYSQTAYLYTLRE